MVLSFRKQQYMKRSIIIPVLLSFLTACTQHQSAPKTNSNPSDRRVGGPCEGCEAIYECPVPFGQLNETDTLPDFAAPGPRLIISGVVYKADGKTPAPGIILYLYHTNQQGLYETGNKNAAGWEKRHGSLRGWIKTNERGAYTFFTLRPASYPRTKAPQHIHPVIKEPGCTEYYIDEFLFDDDPNLTSAERNKQEERGGSGIIKLTVKDGVYYGQRDIYLGRHIPGYAK
jgi:protocatechuate 3,4-dioxygenase, beta subunit